MPPSCFLALSRGSFRAGERGGGGNLTDLRGFCVILLAGSDAMQVIVPFGVVRGTKAVREGCKSIPVCHGLNALCRLSRSPVCDMRKERTCCVISLNMPIIQPRDNLLNSSA